MPGRREQNRQDKRERLCRAARVLFRRRGFESTTIAQIADAAGVAKGTVFLYAPDKHGLLFLVFMDDLAALSDEVFKALPEGPLIERLLHVFEPFFALYEKQPALSLLFLREVMVISDERLHDYEALTLRFLERVGGVLEEGRRRGEVRDDADLLVATQNLFAIYATTVLGWLKSAKRPRKEDAVAAVRRGFEGLFLGLAPPAPVRTARSR